MEDNKLTEDPSNEETPGRMEDKDGNIDISENDRTDNAINTEGIMDKLEDSKIAYISEDNTENSGNLENTNTTRSPNNENNIEGFKEKEQDIIINCNIDNRETKINRSNSLSEGLNNNSWAKETEKADIMRELLEENAKKMKIIENLVKERERWETELRNKDKIIQNLIKEKQERKIEETNIEENVNKRTQVRNIKTKIKELKWQLDIKNKETRDIYDEVENLLLRLDELESQERPLEYNRTRKNEFQKQAKHNMDIYQISSGNNETRNNNYQNNFKTHKGGNYNWRKLPCRLHGPEHIAGNCEIACGFCRIKGSHKGENCQKKDKMIDQFIYTCIQKFGIAAIATAKNFIKPEGIILHSDEEFEKKLIEEDRVQ